MKKNEENINTKTEFSISKFFWTTVFIQLAIYFFVSKSEVITISFVQFFWFTWVIYTFHIKKISLLGTIGSIPQSKKKFLWPLSLLPIFLCFSACFGLIFFYLAKYSPQTLINGLNKSSSHSKSSLTINIISLIIAPLLEEMIFRGLIFNQLLKKFSTSKAIIYSSLIFGAMHVQTFGILQFFIGIILCLAYINSEFLFIPVIMHFLWNLTSVALSLISSEHARNKIEAADLTSLVENLEKFIPLLYLTMLFSVSVCFYILVRFWPTGLSNSRNSVPLGRPKFEA